ncbi:MAG: patatin-like phospholipase family protein [Anaerolineaceae bacterium]|jgi:NTE family protein|nr:patatin-like phospholipase family protein [Anaerolineaceae bacterium]MDI9530903.1 patatin-like phospholipase family protein [Chloroflexota bacterium]
MAKEIVLALGGGGVRGIAHLGVVQCLLDNNYELSGIAGTSAGGMFGAPLAAQVPTREILSAVIDFFKSPNFRRAASDAPSMVGTAGLEQVLGKFLDGKTFADLAIQLSVTSVSLKTGEEVVISEGEVMKAVLATIAIPGVFPTRGDDILVDGGVLDPVPVEPARAMNPSIPLVAVPLHTKPAGFSPLELNSVAIEQIPEAILDRWAKTRIGGSIKNFNLGIEIGSDKLTELNLEITKPDVIVRPVVGHYGTLQKVDPTTLYDEGYRAMEHQLPELADAFSFVNSLKRITKYTTAKPD